MKVAFIGLGIMGLPMATNISKKFDLIGYDIFKKDTPFKFAKSYEECANFADVIISMVPNNDDLITLVNDMLPYLRKDQVWVDMSTISPLTNLKMVELLKEQGVTLVDAPVVKSQAAAISGDLGIYFGGDDKTFEYVLPILKCMGKNIIHIGPNSKGLVMKIVHNALVSEIQNGVNETLGLARELGLNLEDAVKAISYGGAQSFYLDTKSSNIINREYKTAFSVSNMNKDVHFAIELADSVNKKVPALRHIAKIYEEAMNEELSQKDFSSTYEIVNKKNE